MAARELREETGLVAGRLIPLGGHDVQSARFGRADVERMIDDGTITDAKSAAAYTLLLLHGKLRSQDTAYVARRRLR